MTKSQLTVRIVSQEKELVSEQADMVTAQTVEGQITILPGHLPLFSKLTHGELIYKTGDNKNVIAVSQGFIDVGLNNSVTIIVDIATQARDISLQKAEAAIKAAQETLSKSQDQRELIMAEASLRQAMLEVKIAQKSKKSHL